MIEAVGAANIPLKIRVAAEVRAWRARRSMTQVQLARALGISQAQVSSRLRGETPITLDEIDRLAEIFETDPETLLTSALANSKGPQRPRTKVPSLPRVDSNHQPAGYDPPQVTSKLGTDELAAHRVRNGCQPVHRLTSRPFGPFPLVPVAAIR